MKKQFIYQVSVLCLVTMLFSFQLSTAQTHAKNAMVSSDNVLASKIGIEIVKNEGNAIDATVAIAFALAVVHPQAGNIGGGGFIVYMDKKGEATTIDFREKAPLAAGPHMFQNNRGELIEGSNHEGLLSVGVPGTVAGLYLAHEKYGKLPWNQLVEPAIILADAGIELSWTLSQHAKKLREKSNTKFLQNYFNDDNGAPTQFGEKWKQKALAKTLRLIRDKGRDGFYKGEVAEEIEKYMADNGGIITKRDLEKYSAVERKPIKGSYKGYDIYGMPPPSSGGVAIVEMLNLMELANFDKTEFNSTEYVHLVAEVMRRAFADRAQHLGDPDFNIDMPIDRLISKEFAKMRFENISLKKASFSDSLMFGHPYDGKNTTHFSVVDNEGNAVSMTYTLEQSYGSGLGSSQLGFIFNNEMGDFNPVDGVTKTNGQIGTMANLIAPEKRMLSSMSPTIIAKGGQAYMVIGTPGGRTIINTVFQTILNVLEFDMPIDRAIEAMKIHHQWLPDKIYYEKDKMSPDTKKALEKMGHHIESRRSLGRLMGIIIDRENGVIIGASDSSSPDGAAVGY